MRFQTLRLRSRVANFNTLESVFSQGDIGDWFLFLLLARNIDPMTFKKLIEKLQKKTDQESFTINMDNEKESKDETGMFRIEKVDDLKKF